MLCSLKDVRSSVETITVVSLMSPNVREAHKAIVELLAARSGLEMRFVEGVDWEEQLAMLDTGEAQAAFLCGLPYVRRSARLEALAAPVQLGERYGGQPVYFSDVLVRAGSAFRTFDELRGACFAFNEPGSLSGYEVACNHLATLGVRSGFFGRAVASGSHLASLRLLCAGTVEAVAVDTTVLDLAISADPTLATKVRSVATLGPNPAPPFVAAQVLSAEVRTLMRSTLAALHKDAPGRAALALGMFSHLAPVTDSDYDSVRNLARRSEGVSLA